MQNLRGSRGFSLLELMIVVAIIAVMSALAAPMIGGMRLKESARGNAQHLAGILADARAQAITQGTNVMVIFSNPVSFQTLGVGAPPAVAQVIQDLDANWVINAGTDVVINVFGAQDTPQGVTPYGAGPASPCSFAPLLGEQLTKRRHSPAGSELRIAAARDSSSSA